jgi:low temperature requirement protein LtrA
MNPEDEAPASKPAMARYGLWLLAVAPDLVTVVVARHTETLPPDAAHRPERFGLFTLILFGESIVAVMKGIQSQPNWPAGAAIAAFSGIGLIFVFWWFYLEAASAASERPIRCRADAQRFHAWSYAHLPLYLGLTATAVGIEHAVDIGGVAHLRYRSHSCLVRWHHMTLAALGVLRLVSHMGPVPRVRSAGARLRASQGGSATPRESLPL